MLSKVNDMNESQERAVRSFLKHLKIEIEALEQYLKENVHNKKH